MKFNLIICTFQRPEAVLKLLNSVYEQYRIPDEILVIDSSYDEKTMNLLRTKDYSRVRYFKVGEENRGLTLQRNFGIKRSTKDIDVLTFLDDDIILEREYFKELIGAYEKFPDAIGIGGYIVDDIEWKKAANPAYDEFEMDGFVRKLGSRNLLRKRLGLLSNKPPGIMPEFSNGFSTGFLPPSGSIYPVEYFMGGVASYRKNLFDELTFSSFFKGYGLYEDMDFCLRASRKGQLYVNTAAKVHHYHEESGRPNKFRYGKMVVRNGWYVWRVKNPRPTMKTKFKWIAVSTLLLTVRIGNIFTERPKKKVFSECTGRLVGLISLMFKSPEIK